MIFLCSWSQNYMGILCLFDSNCGYLGIILEFRIHKIIMCTNFFLIHANRSQSSNYSFLIPVNKANKGLKSNTHLSKQKG